VPPKPADPYFAKFNLPPVPQPPQWLLKVGDRLAICGDSITEQIMYSRAMETYLTVCAPQLQVEVRQFGWNAEAVPGFVARMTNDVLQFNPTIVTTSYGMNDHAYRPYQESIGQTFRLATTAMVEAFKANGLRVVLGSPGCVGGPVRWSTATPDEMNLSLCQLRNIAIEVALEQDVAFADVFWTMLKAGYDARNQYGAGYAIAGVDGVHPGWSGSFVMAYTFLRSLGLSGEIGRIEVDFRRGRASTSEGHELISFDEGQIVIRSRRYPFCATGDVEEDTSIRSAMTLVPFNSELNRLVLIVENLPSHNCRITWGGISRTYTDQQLSLGINLAEDFETNPFLAAFTGVDRAVAAKQAFETQQIKTFFRTSEAATQPDEVLARTEEERYELVRVIRDAFVPVTHSIRIEPL
jgi:hypothetical protein